MSLSVVTTARDEAAMLPGCLELLGFADEIVVVIDDRTIDNTEKIARKHTDNVSLRAFDTFKDQKNFAISKATGDWIFIVDADERITPAMAAEITETLKKPEFAGYRVGFRNFFLGQEMKHGDWTSEANPRLIKRQHATYVGDVHETFEVPGGTGMLKEKVWHLSHRDMASQLDKALLYTQLGAKERAAHGYPKVTSKGLLGAFFREFWRRMVKHRAYKDGVVGVIEAVHQSYVNFCMVAMIWEYQQKLPEGDAYRRIEEDAKRHA